MCLEMRNSIAFSTFCCGGGVDGFSFSIGADDVYIFFRVVAVLSVGKHSISISKRSNFNWFCRLRCLIWGIFIRRAPQLNSIENPRENSMRKKSMNFSNRQKSSLLKHFDIWKHDQHSHFVTLGNDYKNNDETHFTHPTRVGPGIAPRTSHAEKGTHVYVYSTLDRGEAASQLIIPAIFIGSQWLSMRFGTFLSLFVRVCFSSK